MGIRIEQVDVTSVSKVFITRVELDNRVVEVARDYVNSLERIATISASEGVEINGNKQDVTISVKKASSEELGGIRVGRNLTIDENGVLSSENTKYEESEGIELTEANEEGAHAIKIRKATMGTLGGIKLGTGLVMNDSGVTSVNVTELPEASNTNKGLVKLGNGLTFNEETRAVDVQFRDDVQSSEIAMEIAGRNIFYNPTSGKLDTLTYNVGQGLSISDLSGTEKVIDINKATIDTVGVVKPGNNLTVQEDGTLDLALPKSSKADFGVVKLGNRLDYNASTQAVDVNIETASYSKLGLVKVGGKNTTITSDGVLDAVVGNEEIQALNNTIKDLMMKITNLQQEVENITTILGQLDRDTVVKVYGHNFICGTNTFNGLDGIKIDLPEGVCTNANYTVILNPSISTNGNLGEFWIENKTAKSFRVGSSGRLVSVKFDWILMLNESQSANFDSTNFPFLQGEATLSAEAGTTVTLPRTMPDGDYSVYVTPVENHGGQYGEVWTENKTNNSFKLRTSGGSVSKVNYIAVRNTEMTYNREDIPVITGSASFNGNSLVEIRLPEGKLKTKSYQVAITPAADSQGSLGEFWVEEKSLNSFRVRTTGGTTVNFNYVLFGV